MTDDDDDDDDDDGDNDDDDDDNDDDQIPLGPILLSETSRPSLMTARSPV